MSQILIIEQDSMMISVLKKMISDYDSSTRIQCSRTWREGLEKGLSENYEILFLSLSQNGKKMIDVGKKIREKHPNIYICILSVFDESYFAKELFSVRIDKYLTKPFSGDDIVHLLSDIGKQSQYIPDPSALLIIQNIIDRDFFKTYTTISSVVSGLTAIYENVDDLQTELIQLASYIMDQFQVNEHNDLKSLFPLNPQWCKEKELLKIWLYNIVEYIFQRNSLDQYTILQQFFDYLDANKYEHISLTDIIENCNISQGYLSRIFRSQFKMSVMDYVKLKKIQNVKLKLIFSDSTLSDLASKTGFYDGGHVQRLFQRYEGLSVKAFKNGLAEQ